MGNATISDSVALETQLLTRGVRNGSLWYFVDDENQVLAIVRFTRNQPFDLFTKPRPWGNLHPEVSKLFRLGIAEFVKYVDEHKLIRA
jgi:hypothetical protein